MDSKEVFNKVNSLADWATFSGNTTDTENSHIENKEVGVDLNSAKQTIIGDFKLRIAKEMSAFANTDSGVIALGVDKEQKINNKTVNLEDWLDKNARDLLEPHLSGIDFKTCRETSGEFVLVYIPKGNVIPYRVNSVKSYENGKRSIREYYQRIGTSSVPIPMPIVRSLYLSNERSTDISAFVRPVSIFFGNDDEPPYIELGIEVSPDKTRLINEYYLEANIYILDKDLKKQHTEPIDTVSFGLNSSRRPIIPPDSTNHIIDSFKIQSELSEIQPGDELAYSLPSAYLDNSEHVTPSNYNNIGGIYAETKFACDGLPLKTDRRLLIFDGTLSNDELENNCKEMQGWHDNCLVVSWSTITEKSGLYNKIVSFMNDMNFKESQ